jgi:hypothetical protein
MALSTYQDSKTLKLLLFSEKNRSFNFLIKFIMKIIFKSFILFLIPLLSFSQTNTQLGISCTRSPFSYGTVAPSSGTVFLTISNYGPGYYFQMPVLNGGYYSVSTCGASIDTQISAFQNPASTGPFAWDDDNGPICTGSNASIDMVPNFTDYALIDVKEYNCQPGGSASINVFIRQNNNLNFTSSNAPMCSGQTRTLTATPVRVSSDPTGLAGNLGTFGGMGTSTSTGTLFTAPFVTTPTTFTITYFFGHVSQTQTILVNPNPTVTASPSSTIICNGNQATLNGGGASTYTWSGGITNGTPFTPTATTIYTVTGTSAAGCVRTATSSVVLNPVINTSTSVTNVLCFGNSTGSATITATGGTPGYTYLWSTAATTSVITGLNAGIRTVTVTDGNGCTRTNTVSITQPTSGLSTSTAVTNVLCFGNSNGSATVAASGGIAGYTYAWSTGATTSVITALNAGVRTVTVTDANACTSINSVIITQPSALTLAINPANPIICSGNTQTLSGNASGGTGAITYSWNTSATSQSISVNPLSNTNYTLTVTDANSCTLTSVKIVTVNPTPTIAVNSGSICSGNSFTIIPSGGSTYSIQGGTSIVTPTSNSTYTVSGTSTAGCIGNVVTSTVIVNSSPIISAPSQTICVGSTGTLIANGASTYTWNTGSNSNSITANPLATTNFTVNGTSAAGCLGTAIITTITVGSAPSIVVNSATVCAGSSATLTANGVTTYTWNTGATTNSIVVTPTVNTTYTVNGDLLGCGVTANNTSTVTVNILPNVTIISSNPAFICSGQTATLTGSGAATYTWNTGANTNIIIITPTVNTTYTLNGTDANGCSNTTTITQNVDLCTSLDKYANNSTSLFSIYPNPTKDMLFIISSIKTSASITDLTGRVILSVNLNEGENKLQLNDLKEGVYFINLIEKTQAKATKFIKE